MGSALIEYAAPSINNPRLPPPPPPPPPKPAGLVLVGGRRFAPAWASRAAVAGVPDWYRQMQGTTLGDDTLAAMTDDAFKRDVIANQKALIAAQKTWAEGDKMQKWIAIAATLAIPLSAAIWRAIGIGRRRPR